ncbi:GIY-YIG nuclease family protein [Salegentibacter chungangensis]|uniref:GIY-YIG nuclease family protein n=1 Tax=Salegentibacter chungangensis TaxID=1335724 RepID=A0ABW3NP38_9FLAO
MKHSYVYILTNKLRESLYIGVTSDLKQRVLKHKQNKGSFFSRKNRLSVLLYFEKFPEAHQAIGRKKILKNWHEEWKWNLIKSQNPNYKDLFEDI